MLSLRLYADDHQGKLPDKLQELIPDYCEDGAVLNGVCFLQPGGTVLSSLPPTAAVLVSAPPLTRTGVVIVVCANGSGQIVHPEFPQREAFPIFHSWWMSIAAFVGLSGWVAAFAAWAKLRSKRILSFRS
jgi:hypothetical protein